MIELLSSVRVLDFTHVHAGPLCTYQLALMGAEIIKIESPEGGDMMRGMGVAAEPGMTPGFVGQSANKASVALDLKHADGLAVVHELLPTADVIIHNMRPGTMERLGLGVEAVRALNDKLIYCAISGYGQTGPYAERAALDHLMQGESGMFHATGMPEGPPVRVGFAVVDASTAVIASSAVCAALYRREQTGQGVFLDVSMLECALTVMGLNVYNYLGTGRVGPRVGPNPLARSGSVGTFQTQTNSLLVNANNYRLFERMARAVGREDLLDKYPQGGAYLSDWEALRAEFGALFATDSADHWEALLSEAGVPVGQVRSLDQVIANPQLEQRQAITDVAGTRHIGAGFQVDGAPTAPHQPAERIGASTRAVLSSLDYSAAEIERLAADGAIGLD